MNSTLVPYLESELERRGWKANRLAEEAGIHKSTLSKWMKNPNRIPDLVSLDGIARVLDVPLAHLIRLCGFEPRDDDGMLDVEQTALLLEAVPELRPIADAMGEFSAEDRRALLAFAQGMRQQQGRT